jgi:hypothetical protein
VRRLGAVKNECGTSWCSCHEYRQDLFGLFYAGRLLCAEGEDWSGEAAVIEREMKRFREKMEALVSVSNVASLPPAFAVVVSHGEYQVVSSVFLPVILAAGARLVYSPEEGA